MNWTRLAIGLLALPFLFACRQQAGRFDENSIVLSLGVISDTHIGNGYGSEEKFKEVLTQLEEAAQGNLAGVLIVGDLVNVASTEQISTFKQIYESVLDPVKVPMVYTVGNHDMNPQYRWTQESVAQNAVFHTILGDDYFKTDLDPAMRDSLECRHCVIGEYHILCLTPDHSSPVTYAPAALDWLEARLKEITEKDPDHYILFLTHPMIYGTCYGSVLQDTYTRMGDYWSTKELSEILSRYPQVITFGGHLHFPLNDPRSIWQGAFTAVGTASTSYMAIDNGNYEDMATVTVMKGAGKFSQGLLLQFDKKGNARLTRMDFYNKAVIGEPWELGAPRKDLSHLGRYRHEDMKARNTPPTLSSAQFKEGKLCFAAGKDDEFVHHYRITLSKDGEQVALKKILADFYKVPLPSQMKDSFELPLDGLEEGGYTASIVAVDSWDAVSEPLTCSFHIDK
jgi:predicted phosphodiesterase